MRIMPRIEHYDFGRIVIDEVSFNKDVILLPDRIISNWWRKEGHRLCMDDIKEVLDYNLRF